MWGSYPQCVDEVHVHFKRQHLVLHLHHLLEDERQLYHLAEVDERAVQLVWQRSVEQDQVLQVHAAVTNNNT